MDASPQELLKEYVKSQSFASTSEIMEAMKEMFQDVIQMTMEVELDEELGRVDVKVPRDRNGSFEPKLIGKCSRNAA